MKYRIGIDVGGTFTDAAIINDGTYELIGSAKVPTTHNSDLGVAEGIIKVLQKLMNQYNIKPNDVVFIAHGTTQATNALLEGDVAKVGIITIGTGIEGLKAKSDTNVGQIELAPGKFLSTENSYITLNKPIEELKEEIIESIKELVDKGCETIVAAEAFSVNNPKNETYITGVCKELGIPATATNEISKLYGLKVRTRTAVINASIMPKMLETATMTDESIKNAHIQSQLMVMRCDGGVMSIDEVRNRPILTILSGPAAGVAGALMYERLTDGIFFEVGGTSTDISCVKDGKVMVKYAEVGNHKTYVNSLDVKTVGIGGGSMVQIDNNKIAETGPRSAHIAGIEYEVYAKPEEILNPTLKTFKPKETDPYYAYVECSNGKKYCLTLAGAANILGYVPENDYAKGNVEAARIAWSVLAKFVNTTIEEAARSVLNFAAEKNSKVVNQIIKEYELDPRTTTFVGGGGGASVVVPHLAESMNFQHRLSRNASVISTIGVALAMVREMVERTVSKPTEEDIIAVRKEAEQAVIKSGAQPSTIEISVEVDSQRNLIRATAIGATELRTKDLANRELSEEELLTIVADNLDVPIDKLVIAGENQYMKAMTYKNIEKKFGLFKSTKNNLRLIDREGVIRLQKNNARVFTTPKTNYQNILNKILGEFTEYNDGGVQLPNIYIVTESKIIDVSGLQNDSQVSALAKIELEMIDDNEVLIFVVTNRSDT